jgi:hypothetical protein
LYTKIQLQVTQTEGTRSVVEFLSDFEAEYQNVPLLQLTHRTADREVVRLSYYLDIVGDRRLSTHVDTKTSPILPINTRLKKSYNENIHFINLINFLEILSHVYRVQKETPFLFGNPIRSMLS